MQRNDARMVFPRIAIKINGAPRTASLDYDPEDKDVWRHHILTHDIYDVYSNDATLGDLRAREVGDATIRVCVRPYTGDVHAEGWRWYTTWACDAITHALQHRHPFLILGDSLLFLQEPTRIGVRAKLDFEINTLKRELSSLRQR
jgi:hypothetical protein